MKIKYTNVYKIQNILSIKTYYLTVYWEFNNDYNNNID